MKACIRRPGAIFVWLLATLLVSCSALPVIRPVDPTAAADMVKRCRRPFVAVPYRFVHAIEASLPGGSSGTFVGVAVVDPQAKTTHSALLTLEGFVLFEARYDQGVHVERAVPPFTDGPFAASILEDIRLIFLAPEERPAAVGLRNDGAAICRYHGRQGRITDVVIHPDETWEIGAYRDRYERFRTVKAGSLRAGIPDKLVLTGFEMQQYVLRLQLISAEPLAPEELSTAPGRQGE